LTVKLLVRAKPLLGRSWRYTLVGVFCVVSNCAIMLGVDAAGGHYLLGTLASFILTTPAAFMLHSRFTFRERMSMRSFIRFVSGAASAYPLAAGTMIVLCSGLHLGVGIATPIATIFLFGWNFAAAHWSILPRMRREPAI
jgi:putative flippase GtrA